MPQRFRALGRNEENTCHRHFRNFCDHRAGDSCGHCAVVDFPMENSGAVLALLRLRVIGVLFILLGLAVLLDSFARFALQGLGTPAPPFPTRHLVVTGLYRYVRNPMYVAVVGLIAGQALLLGNRALLFYAIIVWMAFQIFVLLYEEPVLRKTYTAEYEVFCRNVPRWIPRLSAWNAPPSR